MKNQVTILLFLLLFFSPAVVLGQKNVTEEKKKAEQELLLKKVDEEKKKFEEQQKEMQFIHSIRAEEIENAMEEARGAYRIASDATAGLAVYPEGAYQYFNLSSMSSAQNSTSMEFSKKLKESTYSKEFSFDVEKDAEKVSISISGSCVMGEVRIKILTPNGKPYTEVLIDEYGSVNWNKSFSIEDSDSDKTGMWKYSVSAKNATGSFRISVRSN